MASATEVKFYQFLMAPTKGKERALVKLYEAITEDSSVKFPLRTLKDLTRASFTFETSTALLEFFASFKKQVQQNDRFQLWQVKNMFDRKNG